MNYHVAEEGVERAYIDMPYFSYLEEFGALPFPICPTDNIVQLDAVLSLLDGILFTGGYDIDPSLWGETLHKKARLIHPRRQRFDLMLYEQASKKQMPILALCLGMQLINVAHGGSIHQHIPDLKRGVKVEHMGPKDQMTQHSVTLDYSGKLFDWLQTESIAINSGHHQGINRLGEGLAPTAVAEDGIVEAFERVDYPYLQALQWHPERDLASPVNRIVIEKFLQASRSKG